MNNIKRKKIIFASGGTGGHLYPSLAVAKVVERLRKEWEIEFVGRKKSFEEEKVLNAGYKFYGISARGWSRKKMSENIVFPFVMGISVLKLIVSMVINRPAIVFGTGGYVSAPAIAAARILGVKVAIQEQNVFPGWVTKWSSSFADRIFLSFDGAKKYLKNISNRSTTFGVPIRDINKVSKTSIIKRHKLDTGRPVVIVFGGSQGSRALNSWIQSAHNDIIKNTDAQIIWQTGSEEWKKIEESNSVEDKKNVIVLPYLEPMYEYLAIADLVVCRAGASTIAEVTAFGIPSIMVPYPYATGNHQEINAKYVETSGGGVCLLEKDMNAGKFAVKVIQMLQNKSELEDMKRKSKRLGKPDAAFKTAEDIIKMVETND